MQAKRRASCGVSPLKYIHILLHLTLPLSTVGEAQAIAKWSVKNQNVVYAECADICLTQ